MHVTQVDRLYCYQNTFLKLHIHVNNFKSMNLNRQSYHKKILNCSFTDRMYDFYYSL